MSGNWSFLELPTPALLVDVPRAERNVRQAQERAEAAGLEVWPHTKTHKTPFWARTQLGVGARGLTVAKLGEAEVMAEAGLGPLQIFYPLLGRLASERLANLLRRGVSLRVVLDSTASADTVASAAQSAGATVDILVEVDTGMHRVGVADAQEALAVARHVEGTSGLRFVGIASFAGHVSRARTEEEREAILDAEGRILADVREHLRQSGFEVPVVSVGGTHHAARIGHIAGATEIRPGTYIYNDRATVLAGSAAWDTCAATVLATVVSRRRGWAVLDAGSKALASDTVTAGGYGQVLGHPEWVITAMSEEHGILTLNPEEAEGGVQDLPQLGERVRVVPNHICTVVNLFDTFYLTDGERVLERQPIPGRGRSQ